MHRIRWTSTKFFFPCKMLWQRQLWRIQQSGKFVIFIVYLSLFLDNMLLTVVVPIIPDILYKLENADFKKDPRNIHRRNVIMEIRNSSAGPNEQQQYIDYRYDASANCTENKFDEISKKRYLIPQDIINENGEIGLLFSSKAIVQLAVNPFVGPLTNRMGCTTPLFIGTFILISSSLMFAYGETYSLLFAARSIHGVGSACISIAGMAMIADKYPDDKERSKIMGITLGAIAAGVLVGYPIGGIMYDFVNKSAPLLLIMWLLILDAVLLLVFLRPRLEPERLLVGTSIVKLMKDPYIILASGAICVSTLSIAFLEPCLPIWLMEVMSPPQWQLGTVFIPDSLGYLLGTNLFGPIAFRIGRWLTAMLSLVLVGVCAILIPFFNRVIHLVIPHFGLGLGIGIIDSALMPLLAFLVDSRYVALYGSVYAIAQIAVCLAYSIGPLFGGYLVKNIGFPWVLRGIGILNILYCPFCYFLKDTSISEENKAITMKGNDENVAHSDGRTEYSSFTNEN